MISINSLLNYLKNKNITYIGNFNKSLKFKKIEVLYPDSDITTNTLFISSDENSVLKFISSDEYSNSNCCIALISKNKINNENLCQIITEHNLEYIFNLLNNFIFNNFSLLIKQNYIYDSLYSSTTMEDILNTAEKYLCNPIFLVDISYALLCRSSMAKVENPYIDKYNDRYYLKFDIVNLMNKNNYIDTLCNSSKPFFHYDKDNIIFCPIKINNITTAYICVQEDKSKFNNFDLELINTLSKVVAEFSQKEHYFTSNSGLCDEYYLMDLISNNFDDIDYIKDRLKNSEFDLKENNLIISIPFLQEFNDYRYNFGLKQLMQLGKTILKNALSVYYENNIVFLISSSDPTVITDNMTNKFREFLKFNNLKCGISFTFNDLNNIHDYLNQSINAAKLSTKLGYDDFIFYFEDCIDYYFFSITDSKNSLKRINLKTLIHPYIKALINYDKENNSELFKTLKVYFQNNKNSVVTSQLLNINRSTFFYRFHKIENILNIDLTSYSYKIKLALQLLSYLDINA